MGSSFGHAFRIHTFGESHGGAVGVVIDGCPPGIEVDEGLFQEQLDRRKPGQSKLTTPRKELDVVEILSGVFEGRTIGAPIALMVRNKDQRPEAYVEFAQKFRPSHADFSYEEKYGLRAWAGGGRASARETIGRVAAGALAQRVLELQFAGGLEVVAWVSTVQEIGSEVVGSEVSREQVDAHPTRCPDGEAAALMEERILKMRSEGNSVGGVVECVVRGVPSGWGEPIFDKLEADLAKAMLSLPATKGFEIGSGFAGTLMTGLEHNDAFVMKGEGKDVVGTRTNFSGGIQGGITNGEEICFRVAFKPTATVMPEQDTVDKGGNEVKLKGRGRHDPCVLPRAVPIVEAMTSLVLLDHAMRGRGQGRYLGGD